MGDSFPQAQQVEGLRQALLKLEPTKLLSVVAGMDSLPAAHPGMRMGFQALAAESFAHASVGLMEGEAWGAARDAMFETLRYAPQQQSMLAALETELRNRGAGAEQMARLQELIQQLDWEGQSMEEKLRQTQEQGRLWQLSLDQRLRFLRRLLDEGRVEGLLSLLEQILEALRQEDVSHREMAAQTLTGIARWMEDPGLPIDAEGPVIEGLSAHFGWEPLAHIHRASTEALAVVIASQVNRDEPGQALALLRELAGLCAFQDSRQEWREAALTSLWETLAEPAFLRRVAELLHTANSETMLTELIPYFEAVGHPAAQLLVEILGDEPDRKRRGRMLEAIRCLGEQALPAVYEGLSSPAWYLVRNTLNLLADMGDASAVEPARACLAHPDGRVKRAAVRTLYKLGGPASVAPLLAAFPVVDPETQLEIMFAMGQVRAAQAVPALAAFAQDRRNDERLRVRAAETIGQIGDPRSIPVLAELARRRGMIFTSAEPIAVRLAACRALAGLDTPLATETLCELVAAEPWHKDRSVLQQVVNEHRPA
jgi:HEAT repeat protein